MKQYFILITLFSCNNTQITASFPPEIEHVKITQLHLDRISFQRGLSLFIFIPEAGEKPNVLKNNVTRSVTQATKRLFLALIKQANTDTIARCLRSGADAKAHITFEHQGATIFITPALIVTALKHPNSTEIFEAFALADSRMSDEISQIASNEPEVEDLFQKVMSQYPQAHGTNLPLTPPESPQEAKALLKTTHDLAEQELRTFLLSLRI